MKTVISDKSLRFAEAFDHGRANESAWGRWTDQREQALALIVEQGLQTRGREEWLFGNAGSLAAGESLPLCGAVSASELPALNAVNHSHLLVFVNGVYDADRSRIGNLPAGAVVAPLSASDEIPAVGSVLQDDVFSGLNTAFWRDGLNLQIAAGTVLEHPVELHFINGLAGQSALIPVRNVVQVGEGASVTLIERFVGQDDGVAEQPLTEVVCGAGATVQHIKVLGGRAVGEHHGSTHVSQAADSSYQSWEILTGGRLSRREIHLVLSGTGATCDLNALYMGSGEQRMDLRTRVRHDAAGCETKELYKGILDDSSRGVFDGLIYVAKNSQQTNAHQTNRNLLLSDDAVANSIPRLEIYADDVKCSHGSTMGQLSSDQLFYLSTRGFSPEEARIYLAWAFASEVIESIPVASLRDELSAELTRTLAVFDAVQFEGKS